METFKKLKNWWNEDSKDGNFSAQDTGNEWLLRSKIYATEHNIESGFYVSENNGTLQKVKLGPIFDTRPAIARFTGRQSHLEEIQTVFQDYIQTEPGDSRRRAIVVQGEPGSGKTSFVAEFLHRQNSLNKFKSCHVLWIPADSKGCIRDKFIQVCENHFVGLKAELRDSDGNLRSNDQVMGKIYDRLCSCHSVIIFDNASCEHKQFNMTENIEDFLCKITPSRKFLPMYIVTTRISSTLVWDSGSWQIIELGTFTPEESRLHVNGVLPNLKPYEKEVLLLGDHFSHLPIAVEHFTNIMTFESEAMLTSGANYDPTEFIAAMIENKSQEGSTYHTSTESNDKLAHLWDYSLQLVEKSPNANYAQHILNVLSLLSPSGVPEKLLVQLLQNYDIVNEDRKIVFDVDKFRSCLHTLRLFSVVQIPSEELRIHVLLQDHLKTLMQSENSLDKYVEVTAAAMIKSPDLASYNEDNYAANFRNLECICRSILKYMKYPAESLKINCAKFLHKHDCNIGLAIELLETLLSSSYTRELGTETNSVRNKPLVIILLSECYFAEGNYVRVEELLSSFVESEGLENVKKADHGAQVFHLLGATFLCQTNYDEAIKWYDLAGATAWRQEQYAHFSLISNTKAVALSAMGRHEQALSVCLDTCNVVCEAIGQDHLVSMKLKTNLANFYSENGNFPEAIRLLTETHDICCKKLGPEHPDSLKIKNNLASLHADAGNLEAALRLTQQVEEAHSRILGPQHVNTLTSKHNLANRYYDAGNLEQALKLGKEVSELHDELFGPQHPSSLQTKSDLAIFYSKSGDYQTALMLSKEVFEAHCTLFGPDHPHSLSMKNNLANRYDEIGNVYEARRLCKEILDVREKTFGLKHLDTLRSKAGYAGFCFKAGAFKEAVQNGQEVYQALVDSLGSEHPDTLSSKFNLVEFHAEAGNLSDAVRLCEEVVESRCKTVGPEHPDSLQAKNKLASILYRKGDLHEAFRLCKEVNDTQCWILGSEHPDSLDSKNNLAKFCSEIGMYEQAVSLSEQVYKSYARILGPHHPDTLRAKGNLASRFAEVGMKDLALRLAKEVVDVRSMVQGPNHHETLASKHNLANRLAEAGNTEEALILCKQVYEAYCELKGPEHLDTLNCQYNLASRYFEAENFDEALKLGEKVSEARSRILGPEHPASLKCKGNLAAFYYQTGNVDKALSLGKEVHDTHCKVFGPEHPESLSMKNNLAGFYHAVGNLEEAVKLCKEVYDSYCKTLGRQHPDTLKVTFNLGVFYDLIGNLPLAYKTLKEAKEGMSIVFKPGSVYLTRCSSMMNDVIEKIAKGLASVQVKM